MATLKEDHFPPSNEDSYSRLKLAGEMALQRKEYASAKVAFDELLKSSKNCRNHISSLIPILDLRIEAQLQLKNLRAALEDGRCMIRHDRADPRGYLRCGQVCRLQNDFATAEKWYQQGLKNVPQNDKSYRRLETMRSKISGKNAVTSDKFRDPLVVLPLDIVHMVWGYLDFRQTTICLRVSKTWRNALLAVPALWKVLDLTRTRKAIGTTVAKACIRRLPKPPTTVKLDRLTDGAVIYLRPYIERWKSIEHLAVFSVQLLNSSRAWFLHPSLKSIHLGEECSVPLPVVERLIQACPMLRVARLCSVSARRGKVIGSAAEQTHRVEPQTPLLPHLDHLELILRWEPSYGFPGRMPAFLCLENYPNVTKLDFSSIFFHGQKADFSAARSLRHLSLKDTTLDNTFSIPSSLESLVMNGITKYGSHPSPSAIQNLASEPVLLNLKMLEVRNAKASLHNLVQLIGRSCGATLTHLDLYSSYIEVSELESWLEAGKLSKLTFLRTSQVELVDDDIGRIASHCPLLETVEFWCLAKITGVAIKELCLRTAVKVLALTDCRRISPDALHWARDRGVAVSYCRLEDSQPRLRSLVHYP